MKIQLATTPLSEITNSIIVYPVLEKEKPALTDESIVVFLKENPDFGKFGESQLFFTKNRRILLLGLGKKDRLSFQVLQNWAGTAVRSLLTRADSIAFVMPELKEDGYAIKAMGIGIEIAAHETSYKSEKPKNKLNSVQILVNRALASHQEDVKKGQLIAEAMNLVRELGDRPANEMTPTYFLNRARKLAKDNRLRIVSLDEKQAKLKGMGAFIGVAQGSDEPSYMIALEYLGDPKSKDKWALVGKGITFDSGGISIKPANGMEEMKNDMVGAATALATIVLASKLKLKKNIVTVAALTENMPGGRAQRPGDIVKTYSGKTAEVLNTDAEGRLVLSDALWYAQKDFKANKIVDLATLTGAIIVALGDFHTGVFGNNAEFTRELIETGKKLGELFWEMPLGEEFDEMVKSDMADITNIGHGGSFPGAAGAITAAKFLEAFIDQSTPWIHLDIAGTATDKRPRSFRAAGTTGVGVKTLVELLEKN